jgi:hypothetical protein
MKMICPQCKKTIKEFTPTDAETSLFDQEELAAGEALHFMPCRTCRGVSITEI